MYPRIGTGTNLGVPARVGSAVRRALAAVTMVAVMTFGLPSPALAQSHVAQTADPPPDTSAQAAVVLEKIQTGTATLTPGLASVPAAITSVDMSKAFLTFSVRENLNTTANSAVTGRISGATGLTFERDGTGGTVTVEWSVAEFSSGVSVQRGTSTMGATVVNVPIAAVDLGTSFAIASMRNAGSEFTHDDFLRARLTSPTNLELSTFFTNPGQFVDWQVITYDESAVQHGDVTFGAGDTSLTATVAAVDPTSSWLVYSYRSNHIGLAAIGERMYRGEITNSTTLTFERGVSGPTSELSWSLIEFADGTTAQHGTESFAAATSAAVVPISTVDPTRSIAVSGYQMTGGETPYTTDDVPGVAWFTVDISGPNQLVITRDATPAAADMTWTVLEWPCPDSDGDGLCDSAEDANTDLDGDPATNPGPDTDGDATPDYLDADDDGDGVLTSAENPDPDGDGHPRDAADADFDRQPDYLDVATLDTSGAVNDEQKISDTAGSFSGTLTDGLPWGESVAPIGDLDNDGVVDIVVGQSFNFDGFANAGSIWVLLMNSDGTVKSHQQIGHSTGGFGGSTCGGCRFGYSVTGLGDLDADNVEDIAVGVFGDSDGGSNRGAVWIIFLNADGTVKGEQKISDLAGGLVGSLADGDHFGSAVERIGDLDGDGIPELAVGASGDDSGGTDRGAVWILSLDATGTVTAEQKISDLDGGFTGTLDDTDMFGEAIAEVGDVDGDGIPDIVVGAPQDDEGGFNSGALWVLFMNASSTVKGWQKLSETVGGITGPLSGKFGTSVAPVGDADANGITDIIVGAPEDSAGGSLRGAVWILTLTSSGTVINEFKISSIDGGLTGPLDDSDQFGNAVAPLGDLDGDGRLDVVVGAWQDDDGGSNRGAVHVLDLSPPDSDGDGLWDHEEDANTDLDGDPATNPGPDTDGDTTPDYLDADDDGDSLPTSTESADPNGDGSPRDALDSDHDGQPDYLDSPVTAAHSFTVSTQIEILGSTIGATIDDNDEFGNRVESAGDINGDGVVDLAVTAYNDDDGGVSGGAIYLLFMNSNGTVQSFVKHSGATAPWSGLMSLATDRFGSAVATMGDVDGDTVPDLAIGARNSFNGQVFLTLMNSDGSVKSTVEYSDTAAGLTSGIVTALGGSETFDDFGSALANVGDLDGNGVNDLFVGDFNDDTDGLNAGAGYTLLLEADGSVSAATRISSGVGGFTGTLIADDEFGTTAAPAGDIDGDGVPDVFVAAPQDDDAGSNAGAAYLLLLNSDGSVKSHVKYHAANVAGIDSTASDDLGDGLASPGDLDGNGVNDLLLGARDFGMGVVFALYLDNTGAVLSVDKIDAGADLTPTHSTNEQFGGAIANIGDLDEDGRYDIAVGAFALDDGGTDRGGFYILDLSPAGFCTTVVDVPQSECEALEDLYNSTNGASWTTSTGWMSDTTVDNWHGVTVSGGNVTSLALQSNNLAGPLPASIEDLTQLTQIWFDDNGLTGPIPTEITNMTQLTHLDLSDNSFSGTIPAGVTLLTNLVQLWLNGNSLTGTIPADIGDLTQLTGLGLNGNALSGTIPPSITSLTLLTELWLDGNSLTGTIPTDIGSLNLLTDLGMSNNSLTGTVPPTIGDLTLLTQLWLNSNSLSGSIPAEIGNLTQLTQLGLNVNGFAGVIPSQIGNLTSMSQLWLGSNNLSGPVPDSVRTGMAAAAISLGGNQCLTGATATLRVFLEGKDPNWDAGCNDTDGDGIFDHFEDSNSDGDFDPSTTPGPDTDGDTTPDYLDADDDGDLLATSLEQSDPNGDGHPADALDTDADRIPDFLDTPVQRWSNWVVSTATISSTSGGLTGPIDDGDLFGIGVDTIGDLDADGVVDLIVAAGRDDDGGSDAGAAYILLMNSDGTVKAEQKLSATAGGWTPAIDAGDEFSSGGVSAIGDLDGDGTTEVAIGAFLDDDGGSHRGAVYIVFLNTDGTVKDHTKISDTQGGFGGALADTDYFGYGIAPLGDLDADGVVDIAVGAYGDDTAASAAGAVWILFLNADGTVKAEQKLTEGTGGFTGDLDADDNFGENVELVGDFDGDGSNDILVGAWQDDDGGTDRGAAYLLLLNPDGTVHTTHKISSLTPGVTGLEDVDWFGYGSAAIGDRDGDGVLDLAIGANGDDGTGTNRGAFHLVYMNADGTVKAMREYDEPVLRETFIDFEHFASDLTSIGDLDGDGGVDLVVGTWGNDDGGTDRGALHIVFLDPDTDVDGVGDFFEDRDRDGNPANDDTDGDTTPDYLDIDDDGDALSTSSESADPNGDGDPRDAFDSDHDGEPDYLDEPFTTPLLQFDVGQKISDLSGGLAEPLSDTDWFGAAVTSVGDLDGDGVVDLAIGLEQADDGAVDAGMVIVAFMNTDGTVKAEQVISSTRGGLVGPIDGGDKFGTAVANIGDVDGDGNNDLAVGAFLDDDGGSNAGAVYVLFLNADGTVKAEQKISNTAGGLTATLDPDDRFGLGVSGLGDIDSDGVPDLVVGSPEDDDGSVNAGAVYVLFLNTDGTVKAEQKISNTAGGLTGPVVGSFGIDVAGLGDIDGDGITDIAVGAFFDGDGGLNAGALWVVRLNADGTAKAEQKVTNGSGGLGAVLAAWDLFGVEVAQVGDVDGDGVPDVMVGAIGDDTTATDAGELYVINLNSDGTVKTATTVADATLSISSALEAGDSFGRSIAPLGDLDGDGQLDFAIGTDKDDDGGSDRGAVYILNTGAEFCTTVVDVPAGDCDALAQLYFSTTGTGWTTNTGWLSDTTVANWHGITVSGGRVTEIDLSTNNLIGPIPATIDGLAALTTLALDDNSLTGSIPVELQNLPALVELGLDTNGLTGILPIELTTITTLQQLRLGANSLTGPIPPEIGDLVNLTVLHLEGNSFDGTLPSTVANLVSLTELHLDSNDLHGQITSELTNLTSLVSGRFNGNRCLSTGPATAAWLTGHDAAWQDGCTDSDGDGIWDLYEDANTDLDFDPSTSPGPDTDGDTIPNHLDPDDDGDSLLTSSEAADPNGDGNPGDALDSDHDGQPDHLDAPTSAGGGWVIGEQKISATTGGLGAVLDASDWFGAGATAIGDLDDDGVVDIAVGATADDDGAADAGAIHILFLNTDGTIKTEQKISNTTGGLTTTLDPNDQFGLSAARLGDLDGDGVEDIFVSSHLDDDGGGDAGAVHILFLNTDGTIKTEQKISNTTGGLTNTLDPNDQFGSAISTIGDLDGDGVPEIAIGSRLDDDGGADAGAVHILFLDTDGTIKTEQKISNTTGGLTATLDPNDQFGSAIGAIGDVDGDGVRDLAVGAPGDDDGVANAGAVHVLLLNSDGTVKAEHKISAASGDLHNQLSSLDAFGQSVAGVGDIDLDGTPDIAVGAPFDDDGAPDTGALYVLTLNPDGSVAHDHKISATEGGPVGTLAGLDAGDNFGASVTSLGDLNGDGFIDLATSAYLDDDGNSDAGSIYSLSLAPLPFCATVTDASIDQCDALLAFHAASGGAGWDDDSGWGSDTLADNWHGVTTVGGVVTAVSLPSNGLTGAIPTELGNISTLVDIDLSGNNLSGSIPAWMATLGTLQTLRLHDNELTGSIPAGFGALGSLTVLDLETNLLTGPLPVDIGSSTTLQVLDVGHNQLTGTIPAGYGSIPTLTDLDVQNNDLTGTIPTELGDLPAITLMFLHNNAFSGPVPSNLGTATTLQYLQLHENALTGPMPTSLGSLTSLLALSVHANDLSGPVPSSLSNLTSLIWLTMHGNQNLGPVPPIVSAIPSLLIYTD